MEPYQYGPIKYDSAEMDSTGMDRYIKRAHLLEHFAAVVNLAMPLLDAGYAFDYAREYTWCHTQLEVGATVNGQYARDTEHMGELSHEYVVDVLKLDNTMAPTQDQRRAISGAFLLIFS